MLNKTQTICNSSAAGLRVGAQKNRLNDIEVILFEYLLCISGLKEVFFIIIKHS